MTLENQPLKPDGPPEKPDNTRRKFIGKAAMAAAGAALGAAALTSGCTTHVGSKGVAGKRRMAMFIDLRKCTGCHACQVACKSEYNVPLGVWRSWVSVTEKGKYPNVGRQFLPRLCNHCAKAPCARVCPVNATIVREDGIVKIDYDKCIGCKSCMAACPYNARFVNPERGVVEKCTFCYHRVDKGVVPACVNTCHANARVFGDLNDPDSEVSRLVATNSVQVPRQAAGTKPQVFYIGLDMAALSL